MKSFILINLILIFSSQSNGQSRADLCPGGTIPLLDSTQSYYGKFKGVKNAQINLGETRTYCIPFENEKDYLFIEGHSVTDMTNRTVQIEVIAPNGNEKSFILGNLTRETIKGVQSGIYLFRVTGIQRVNTTCKDRCSVQIPFDLSWKVINVDPNLKLKCPSDTTEINYLFVSGWYIRETHIYGGQTSRFCAILNEPSFGAQFGLDSYSQVSCGVKTIKVTSPSYPDMPTIEGHLKESNVVLKKIVRPGVYIMEISTDQPEMKNCVEHIQATWRPGA